MTRDVKSMTFLLGVAAVGWLIVQFDKGQKESLRRAIANVARPLAALLVFTLLPFVGIAAYQTFGSGFVPIVVSMLAAVALVWLLMRFVDSLERWADRKPKPDHHKG